MDQKPAGATTPLPTVQHRADARKVCYLLPQYRHTNPLTLYSLLANWNREECGLSMHYGDAFIIHTRNSLATKFVKRTKFEWALFVDDDMVLPMGNAHWFKEVTGWAEHPDELAGMRTLDRLMSHGKTLVGALYFGRNHRGIGKAMFAEGMRDPAVSTLARNLKKSRSLRPTEWVGTGCLLIHRSVFESIEQKFPHLAPTEPDGDWHYFTPAPDRSMNTLRHILEATSLEQAKELAKEALSPRGMVNARSGEDVVFCRRAALAGHQPYVDLGLICGHVGSGIWGPSNTRNEK